MAKVSEAKTNVFGATSTTEDVLAEIDLHGKRILVTGVSAGLGIAAKTATSVTLSRMMLRWA
jgi:hypothetical protein